MNPDYYIEYRENELNHWWFRGREAILRALVGQWARERGEAVPPRILNVGCATGRSSEWLTEFGPVESIEYDADCAAAARKLTGLPIQQGSAEDLQYDTGSFDLVTAFDVLEHIEQHVTAVLEMQRVCAPGGLVLVTVPAFQWLWSEHDEVNQHFRRYRREEVTALFGGSDWTGRIAGSSYFNYRLFPMVAGVRICHRVLRHFVPGKREAATSDFSRDRGNPCAGWLFRIFASEAPVLATRRNRFPFGSSIYVAWEKQSGVVPKRDTAPILEAAP
jgi:SAM-dependent methyltransferase